MPHPGDGHQDSKNARQHNEKSQGSSKDDSGDDEGHQERNNDRHDHRGQNHDHQQTDNNEEDDAGHQQRGGHRNNGDERQHGGSQHNEAENYQRGGHSNTHDEGHEKNHKGDHLQNKNHDGKDQHWTSRSSSRRKDSDEGESDEERQGKQKRNKGHQHQSDDSTHHNNGETHSQQSHWPVAWAAAGQQNSPNGGQNDHHNPILTQINNMAHPNLTSIVSMMNAAGFLNQQPQQNGDHLAVSSSVGQPSQNNTPVGSSTATKPDNIKETPKNDQKKQSSTTAKH